MNDIIATDRQPAYPQAPQEIAKWRPGGIKNLTPGLVERGKIKIGMKGAPRQSRNGNTFQAPQKLDHFVVTTMERGPDNNYLQDQAIMQRLGASPREIPVVLVYDDIDLNFPTRYAMYAGKTLQCTGDGVAAKWRNDDGTSQMVQCPCHCQEPTYTGKDKCKINGTLSVIIEGADVIGGVWKFRTTSYNSVVGILSSLAMIKRVSGGVLAGVPLVMKLSPKAVTDPVGGGQQTVYIVSLEYRGSAASLRDQGYTTLLEQQKHGVRIEHIEEQARLMLSYQPDPYESEVDDIVPEFFPEQQEGFVPERVQKAAAPARRVSSFASKAKSSPVTHDNPPQQAQLEGEKAPQTVMDQNGAADDLPEAF